MQGIFVSYRRQDSQSAAGRLSDHLKDHLAGVPIFRDVETIDPGADFVDAIGRALKSCAVLIAVIGPRWVGIQGANGARRLDDPGDYTRLEIATALQRKDVRVIPVLVEGAVMPAPEDLPDNLQALARRNAVELSDKRWEYDVAQLVKTLRAVLGLPDPDPLPPPPPPPPPARRGRVAWLAGAGVLVLALLSALLELDGGGYDGVPLVNPQPVPRAVQEPAPLAQSVPAAVGLNLTGLWADSSGGQHRIVQQGQQLAIQGMSPQGMVMGSGGVQGRDGWINYTLNGYPLQARFTVAPDGVQMEVLASDPATGQQTALRMWRTQ